MDGRWKSAWFFATCTDWYNKEDNKRHSGIVNNSLRLVALDGSANNKLNVKCHWLKRARVYVWAFDCSKTDAFVYIQFKFNALYANYLRVMRTRPRGASGMKKICNSTILLCVNYNNKSADCDVCLRIYLKSHLLSKQPCMHWMRKSSGKSNREKQPHKSYTRPRTYKSDCFIFFFICTFEYILYANKNFIWCNNNKIYITILIMLFRRLCQVLSCPILRLNGGYSSVRPLWGRTRQANELRDSLRGRCFIKKLFCA